VKPEIYVEQDGHVAELVLNRPAKLNTLTPAMFELLRKLSQEINQTRSIHVVILRGEGERAFCAGTDINTLKEYDDFWDWRNRVDYVSQIRAIRQPVIAAVRGWALGGGHELAVAADLRVAGTSAVFGAPEITLGWGRRRRHLAISAAARRLRPGDAHPSDRRADSGGRGNADRPRRGGCGGRSAAAPRPRDRRADRELFSGCDAGHQGRGSCRDERQISTWVSRSRTN
jgi:hypothetical protein